MYVLEAFDRIMIQTMVGFSAAALYSVACNLGNVLKIGTNSINNSIVPWMYEKLGQGEYEKLGKITTAVIVIPVVPVLMPIAVGPEIIWLFGGNEYASAQYVIPPIAEALVFSFTYTAFTNIEFFFDKNKFVMFASIVASVLNVALNYLLIGPFGYVAAAYTTLLCYAFMAAAHYIYVRRLFVQKKIKCPFSGMVLVGMALLLVGLGFVLTLLYPYTLVRLVFFAVCLVALFVFRKKSVLSLKASKRSAREFRGASCLPNANSVQGKSELSLEGSGKRDSCLTNSLERDKKTGAPELNAGCEHLSSSVQNQAAAYPSSRRPTFDGGRAAGMGTGSNAGSRCHGRPRLSNPGQPFS